MSAVSVEYDPDNKLQHVDYWVEEDVKKEWPRSKLSDPNYTGEEPYDPLSKPNRFNFCVEVSSEILFY